MLLGCRWPNDVLKEPKRKEGRLHRYLKEKESENVTMSINMPELEDIEENDENDVENDSDFSMEPPFHEKKPNKNSQHYLHPEEIKIL